MTVIEINESKFDKMSEYTEKMLKYGGKLMSCLEELGDEYGYGHRGDYGNRYSGGYGNRYGGYGGNMGYRDSDDWDEESEMGERRGSRRRRDSRGRYM